jgi:glycosyltransferase involved in cell wall biosynthesis
MPYAGIPEMIDIAVAIPTFNSEKYIAKALQSTLSQNSGTIPVYVFDNGSTDRTVDICRDFSHVTVHRNSTNEGFSKNIRNCFYEPPHEWVALLCSDDWFESNHIETAMNAFKNNKHVRYYFSYAKLIFEDGRQADSNFSFEVDSNLLPPAHLYPRLLKSHLIPISSLIVHKDTLQKVPEECWVRKLSDWEFTIHITNHFTGWCEKQTTVCYLQRSSSMGQLWYFEQDYSLNRIKLLFAMNEMFPVSKEMATSLIIHRWMEAIIIAIHKRDKSIRLHDINSELDAISQIIHSKMQSAIFIRFLLRLCKSMFVVLVRFKLFRAAALNLLRIAGIGKFILTEKV